MKKMLVFAAALMMVFSLEACGSSAGGEGTGEATQGDVAETAAEQAPEETAEEESSAPEEDQAEAPEAPQEDDGAFIPENHTFGLVGDFNNWTDDVPLEYNGGHWEVTIELPAMCEFRVRADGRDDYSWGMWGNGDGTDANGYTVVEGTYVIMFGLMDDSTEGGVEWSQIDEDGSDWGKGSSPSDWGRG